MMCARALTATALLVLAASVLPAAPAQAAPGDLDPTFGVGGKMTTSFGDQESGSGVALQPDGKIVAVGTTFYTVCDDIWCSSPAQFALARYNRNGTLDVSFANGGTETTDFGGSDNGAHAVALQPDGKIVIAGSGPGFAVARYNLDGSLDRSFDSDGKRTTDFGVRHDGKALAIQADGKIVVAGSTQDAEGNFALARYNLDGSLDLSFSGDGEQSTNFGGRDYGHAIAIQGDGKIVVTRESSNDFAVARYATDGALDASFSGDGMQTTDFGTRGLDGAFDVALQPDGNIVAVGTSNYDFALARYQGGSGGSAPTNVILPTISGSAAEGQNLTVKAGTWSDSTLISDTFQWRRCDSAGANCVDTAAASATSYALLAADIGHTIRVRETAVNAYGQTAVDSGATAVVRASPGAITGTVRNMTNGAAIANASVNCSGGYSATTARKGAYSIPNVAPATYTCTASTSGYRPATQDVAVYAGQKSTANFSLARQ